MKSKGVVKPLLIVGATVMVIGSIGIRQYKVHNSVTPAKEVKINELDDSDILESVKAFSSNVINMFYSDIGVDWATKYRVSQDCYNQLVNLNNSILASDNNTLNLSKMFDSEANAELQKQIVDGVLERDKDGNYSVSMNDGKDSIELDMSNSELVTVDRNGNNVISINDLDFSRTDNAGRKYCEVQYKGKLRTVYADTVTRTHQMMIEEPVVYNLITVDENKGSYSVTFNSDVGDIKINVETKNNYIISFSVEGSIF